MEYIEIQSELEFEAREGIEKATAVIIRNHFPKMTKKKALIMAEEICCACLWDFIDIAKAIAEKIGSR